MPTPSTLLIPMLFSGCAPWGTITTPDGTDRLRAALHYETTEDGHPALLVLLANTPLSCGLPDSDDIDARSDAVLDYVYAHSREGAQLLGLKLFSPADDDWIGEYAVSESAQASSIDRQALVVYRSVIEAQVQEFHGLYRLYDEVEVLQVYGVAAPGTVTVTGQGSASYSGHFQLESLDVSGTFKTESCGAISQVFQWLGLEISSEEGS